MSLCTTSATLESSSHTLDVLEDGTFPIVSSQTERQEGVADFGLISSTVDESPSRKDGPLGLGLDPPGSRISVRVTSLRMRTAAVWDSIPATMDGGSAGDYSQASTPVKSQIISQEWDETESIEHATVYSPSFSSPATSVTAVSDLSPRNSLSRLTMINRKQELTCITPKVCGYHVLFCTHGSCRCEGLACRCFGRYLPGTVARDAGFGNI
jgi:hypothetical protein